MDADDTATEQLARHVMRHREDVAMAALQAQGPGYLAHLEWIGPHDVFHGPIIASTVACPEWCPQNHPRVVHSGG